MDKLQGKVKFFPTIKKPGRIKAGFSFEKKSDFIF